MQAGSAVSSAKMASSLGPAGISIAVPSCWDERQVPFRVKGRAVRTLPDREHRDLSAIRLRDDRYAVGASRENLFRLGIESDPGRTVATLQWKARSQCSSARIEDDDLIAIFDIDEHVPILVRDPELERTSDRNGRQNLARFGIDDSGLATSRIHDPDGSRQGIISHSVRLRTGRNGRDDLAGLAFEKDGIICLTVGGNHVGRPRDCERPMDSLPSNEPIGCSPRL